MENDGDDFFRISAARALNPVNKNPHRVTKELKQAEQLNCDEIEFPTPCSERMFKKFENNNNVSVLVFGHDGKKNNSVIRSDRKT